MTLKFRVSLIAATAVLCMLVTSSCHRVYIHFTSGEDVSFTAATAGTPASKAAYSGQTSADGKYERIDWEGGEMIRIWCAQASEPESHFADYLVDNSNVSSSGQYSQASIFQWGLEDKGLRWGKVEDRHVFYAVYPSPIGVDRQVARSGDVFPGTTSGKEATLTGNIPASQKVLAMKTSSSDPNFTAVPDLGNEYMVARNEIGQGDADAWSKVSGGSVYLTFKPIVTAIEFTIINNYSSGSDMQVKSVRLISGNHNISGQFTADLTTLATDGSVYPACTSVSGSKIADIDFTAIPDYTYADNSDKYIAVAKGKSLRFTFFLAPASVAVDDLYFQITTKKGTIKLKLAYNDFEKHYLSFPCHKKSFVTGVLVPEGVQWMVKYADSATVIESWVPVEDKSLDIY